MFRKQKPERQINFMELVPVKNFSSEQDDSGKTFVLVPRFPNPVFAKIFRKKNSSSPAARIELDAVGAYIWSLIDGEADVTAISNQALEHFGEQIQPVYERVSLFIGTMAANKFINLKTRTS